MRLPAFLLFVISFAIFAITKNDNYFISATIWAAAWYVMIHIDSTE